jgi:hypothetical protein
MNRDVNNRVDRAPADVASALPGGELEAIVGGTGSAAVSLATVGLGMRKSAGNQSSGVFFLS